MGFGPWAAVSAALVSAAVLITYLVMRVRLLQKTADQQRALAEAMAALEAERRSFQESSRAIEESARHKALNEFLADLRIEERRYIRQHRILFAHRKSLVLQERMFFRNVPLSNWVEHEVPVEEGADLDAVAKTLSVFQALDGAATPFGLARFLI